VPRITWSNGYIRDDDAAIYYEVHPSTQADATVLILLHGNCEDMHVFDGRFERLLSYYTVITVDTRGHGKSSRGDKPLSYELFANDLFSLVNKLQIGSFLLLGFSDGANTALQFAMGHQERLAAMILVGGNLDPEGFTPASRRSIQLSLAQASLKGAFSKCSKERREFVELMLNHPHIDPKRLATVNTPTLIINGANDMIRDEHSELIARTLRQARRKVIPDAGHFVMKDAPEAFDKLVYDFLMEDE
jgi:pimeloyl-ACP methyl ester carboxylesterase